MIESRDFNLNVKDLNLNDAVKGLISDKRLVADVKLQQSRRVGPVQNCFIRSRPET